jgi:hypothetical protein
MFTAASAAAARSVLGCASSPSSGQGRRWPSAMGTVTTTWTRCDGGTSCIRGGARAESSTFASTLIDDSGLTAAADALPVHRATWQRYSASSALTQALLT